MMSSAQAQLYLLPSKMDSLAQIEQVIEDLSSLYSIPEELYGNILVSVTEAVNNAIRHGNKFNPELEVEFSFELNDLEFIFYVRDHGAGFDFENVPDPTTPGNIEKPDGRGIFIMQSLANKVEFSNGGSQVCIRFNRELGH